MTLAHTSFGGDDMPLLSKLRKYDVNLNIFSYFFLLNYTLCHLLESLNVDNSNWMLQCIVLWILTSNTPQVLQFTFTSLKRQI